MRDIDVCELLSVCVYLCVLVCTCMYLCVHNGHYRKVPKVAAAAIVGFWSLEGDYLRGREATYGGVAILRSKNYVWKQEVMK